jgi:peptidoglycan hydrolase-like protein with peptidoglycan-binding domain
MDGMLTGQGLADYGKKMMGTPYFYGAKIPDGALTESKMQLMHKMYPSTVTGSYVQKARNRRQVGRVNVDCSGLVAGYRGVNTGSAQLYSTAQKRMPIGGIKDFAVGVVLWKTGHVGIYAGIIDGVPMCYEARGINDGTVMSRVSATKWAYGLTFADISYTYNVIVGGTSKGTNPYREPDGLLSYDMSRATVVSEPVKWLQWELVEAGYGLAIDGWFGPKTRAALGAFQASCKIERDFVCGPVTRNSLKAN